MEADRIGDGRRRYTLNEPKRYLIATVRSPERTEASGIGDNRDKENIHHAHAEEQYHHGPAA